MNFVPVQVPPMAHNEKHILVNKKYQRHKKFNNAEDELTSFPLAPPPSTSISNMDQILSNSTRLELTNDKEVQGHNDPIVLIEDYIPSNRPKKKISVVNLKRSFFNLREASDRITTHNSVNTIASNTRHVSKKQSLVCLNKAVQILDSNSQCQLDSSFQGSGLAHEYSPSAANNGVRPSGSSSSDNSMTSCDSVFTSMDNNSHNSPYSGESPVEEPQRQQHGKLLQSLGPFSTSSRRNSATDSLLDVSLNSLKYCMLCDKPLYDVSSLMTGHQDFKILVCDNCTETYNEMVVFLNAMEFEEETSDPESDEEMDINKLAQLCAIQMSDTNYADAISLMLQERNYETNVIKFEKVIKLVLAMNEKDSISVDNSGSKDFANGCDDSFNATYETLPLPKQRHNKLQLVTNKKIKKSNIKPFSKTLIGALQSQLNETQPSAIQQTQMSWNSIKQKMRWRWRLKGLVPGLAI